MDEYSGKLIIMNKSIKQGPAGPVVTWSEGLEITGVLQISNMQDTLIAQAQGVRANGTLSVDRALENYITLDTYLRNPSDKYYVRVADTGIVEAGTPIFNTRQYSVEGATVLPR